MTLTIIDFKQQNPEYKDMPDIELADLLHSQYYSDEPKDEFFKSVGVDTSSRLESGLRGGYQGLTGNLGDEIQAAGGAAVGTVADLIYGNGFNPGQNYDDALKSVRAEERKAEISNPNTYLAGSIAGSISPVSKGMGLLPKGLREANTLKKSATLSAGVGAGVGGIYGFGAGEGDNRLNTAKSGALIGGITGGILDAGVNKALGRFNVAEGSPILSESSIIPLTKGQATGDNALLTAEMDLLKSGTRGGNQVQDFINGVQKPAATDYLKRTFGIQEGEFGAPSYQNLNDEVMSGIQTKASNVKGKAIELRKQGEANLEANLPKEHTDSILADIKKSLYKYDVNDANQTLKNVSRNLRSSNGSNNLSVVSTPESVAYPKPPRQASPTVQLQGIFNAKKALSNQKNAVGARSVAAVEADQIIDANLSKLIEKGIITGDAKAIDAYKRSVPAFRQYYKTYEQSPSNIFNDVATNPQKYSPDEVFNAVYGKSLGGSQKGRLYIEQVKNTLGEEGSQKLQQGFADAILKKSTDDLGNVSLPKMKTQINNFLSNKSFSESLMNPEQLSSLKALRSDLAKASGTPQNYRDSGTAYNLQRLIQNTTSKDPTGLVSYIFGKLQQAKANRVSTEQAKQAISNTPQIEAKPIFGGIPLLATQGN